MHSVVRSSLVGLLAVAIAGLTACGDKVTVPPPVTNAVDSVVHSVTVSPAAVSVTVGSSVTLAASVDAGQGVSNRGVTWSSSDNTVATVDATGKVTGVKAGTVTVTAASAANAAVRGAAAVTVTASGGNVPTVTISSINNTICGLGGCNSVPANLSNAAGQLDVILNVEPNGQTLKSVQATITCPSGTSMTATQNITGASQSTVAAEAAAAPVTLSFNTAQFNGTTGATQLRNGLCTLSSSATTAAGVQSATNTTQLTLNNQDGVVITNSFAPYTNAEGNTTVTTANDVNGLPWRGGAVTVSAVPVLYSGRTLSSMSITLPGANTATQTVTAAPFSATWSATSTTAPNVTRLTLVGNGLEANQITPVGITPQVVALDANGNDLGLTVLNAGVINNTTFRLDNTPPQPATTFIIPGRQIGWVNAAYTFTGTGGSSFGATGTTKYVACGDGPANASANPPSCLTEIGVSNAAVSGTTGINGQTTFTYYAIPAASYSPASSTNGTGVSTTACDKTGWTKITTGADLAETTTNTAYVVRVFETDKLGNSRCVDLASAPNTINSGVFANGIFGVDKTPPTASILDAGNAACPAAGGCASDLMAINAGTIAAAGGVPAFKVTYSDNASGFSTTPLLTTLTRLAIDPTTGAASTTSTAFGCPIGFSANAGTCAIGNTAAAGQISADAGSATGASSGIDGYYTYTAQIIDVARNTGNTVTRRVVVDRQAPVMGGIAVPATVNGGQSASFATSATDNLDLIQTNYTLSYPTTPANGAQPLNIRANGQPVGVAFDNVLTTSASFSLNVPFFIRSVATTTAAGAPQANAAAPNQIAVRVYDAANNQSNPGVSPINAANVPQTNPTNYTALQANGASFSTFQVSNAATNVSNCPAAGCTGGAAPANAQTVTLSATATGTEGANFQFLNPFTQVQFYYLDAGYAGASNEWILIGSTSGPQVTDNVNQTVRTFTWTLAAPFDPPASLPAGALNVIAVGVNASGDALASANSTAITLTNP